MNQILKPGQIVQADGLGMTCTVGQLLGGGGQGEVYQASFGGKQVALKWYFPTSATSQQRRSLEILIEKGAPNNKFLWPEALTSAEGVRGFGYIMPLREARYKSLYDLMKRKIDPSFFALATAGFELANSFLLLHAKGYSYRDVSFGNVFFDPGDGVRLRSGGEVLICDNDNVGVDGQSDSDVSGTPYFMAPEIVRGEAGPSTQTDLFSLAVLLFYMLMIHHPLEGKCEASIHCMDLHARIKLYGTEPLFIFDPNDQSNAPVPGYQDNALEFWPIYPQFLRDLFIRAFTDGIRDPLHGRVRESEWREAMIRLRDSILYCSVCGAENFYDVQALRTNGHGGNCWSCHRPLQLPFRIRLGRTVVMLNRDTELYLHHTDGNRDYDFSQSTAAVSQNPQNLSQWGLKNLSGEKWVSTMPDGTITEIPPGRSVSLAKGRKIHFGRLEGEIQYIG